MSRAARDDDVVIDLRPRTTPGHTEVAQDRPEGSVIPRHSVNGLLLAAPGLPRVLAVRPPDGLDLGLYRLCAYRGAGDTASSPTA